MTKQQEGDDTIVKLNGDTESKQKARELIEDLINSSSRNYSETKLVYEHDRKTPEAEVIDWKKVSEEAVKHIFFLLQYLEVFIKNYC